MNYKFKFSIIMCVYNVEEYIDEAVESILKQNIGFKKNVQIIFINDGSTDNSEEKCRYYQKMYPNNIIYHKKKNGGLASAKNAGLKYATGELVNFFDPDDILSLNTLSEVYKFFKKNEQIIDSVGIPLEFFEAMKGLHPKYKDLGDKNRVIDLLEEPSNFIYSGASNFYKNELIKKKRHDETLKSAEDAKMSISFYQNNPRFGYVCEKDVKYYYRKRKSNNSLTNVTKVDTNLLLNILNCIDEIDLNHLLDYHIEIILYQIYQVFNLLGKNKYENDESYNKLLKKIEKLLKNVPVSAIIDNKWISKNNNMKMAILKIKGENLGELIKDERLNVSYDITIKDCRIKDNKLIVEILFNNYGDNNLDIIACDTKNNIYKATVSKDINSTYDLVYNSFFIDKTHYRKFVFALNQRRKIKFLFQNKQTSEQFSIGKMKVDKFTRLALKDSLLGMRYKNKLITLSGQNLNIKNYKNSGLNHNIKTFFKILKLRHHIAIFRLLNRRKKQYILINDRPYIASDNGEALFKYICQNEKEMAKKTYFVIEKSSPDYKRLKKIGKVVNIHSFKHKFLFINCKYIYSSHNHRLFYNAFKLDNLKYYQDMFNYQFIWLQHGIAMNDLSRSANRINSKNSKMIVSTEDEYHDIISDRYFFDADDVLLTGLARFDYLENKPQNIISVCPTWRQDLTGKILQSGIHETVSNFENSDYYNNFKNLLTNKKLLKMLKDNNYHLNFVLHSGMFGYKDYFEKFANKYISIIGKDNVNYNQIFAESKLLITDYSSIIFDFAYLKKPEIYFQFDKEDFFHNQYTKGYFSYEKNGFGDVFDNVDDVIKKIEYFFENDFKIENKYLKRIEKTFKYNDRNNCKRIINNTYYKGRKINEK